jgi:hypothetical protein
MRSALWEYLRFKCTPTPAAAAALLVFFQLSYVMVRADFVAIHADDAILQSDLLIAATAIGLLFVLANWARRKGRSRWWGMMGLLSAIGAIVVAALPDLSDPSAQKGFDVITKSPK